MRKQWRKSDDPDEKLGLSQLRDGLRSRLALLMKAERRRKMRKAKRRKRAAFYENPHKFTKKLFEENKSGVLEVPQDELEGHLRRTYTTKSQEEVQSIAGPVRLAAPTTQFDLSEPRLKEVIGFVRRAHAGASPGPNGIPYKVYKACPRLLQLLWKLLKVVWRQEVVPSFWGEADGVYIPKEELSKLLNQFRPISLQNVGGKIFFGVLTGRLVQFLLVNCLVDTSVQKAGLPGFPGCLEHCSMIWHTIQEAKRLKLDLAVFFLDLANAYGLVPHWLIKFALEFSHIPEKIIRMVDTYYRLFKMWFTTRTYRTRWQDLQVGIPMGCTISPILFVLGMEVIVHAAKVEGTGIELSPGKELHPMRAFMDDLTLLNRARELAAAILRRLEELMGWGQLAFKVKKSRSLVLGKGKLDKEFHFSLGEEVIPSVSDQPVTSLGHWYTEELRDTKRVAEIKGKLEEGMKAIDECGLPGKLKLWCLQFGLMPRLMWPLTVMK